MLLQFFTGLREAKVPVTLREYLALLEAMEAGLPDQMWRRSTISPAPCW